MAGSQRSHGDGLAHVHYHAWGADEMNRKKGHNYLTVFVNLAVKRVLLAVEGKDANVREFCAEELGHHDGHPMAITMVAKGNELRRWQATR